MPIPIYTSSNGHYKSDEYYTLYDDVEAELSNYDLTGLKVYCPCDTEESAFVKYLKTIDCELKYTSDDYYGHEDIYEWADIVITNPPFRKTNKWLRFLESKNKNFIVIASLFNAKSTYISDHLRKREWFIDGSCEKFLTPDGTIAKVMTIWYSNAEQYRIKEVK